MLNNPVYRINLPRLYALALGAVLFAPAPLTAELLKFSFTGEVRDVFDGLGAIPNVAPGTGFHGYYVFDTETPNTGGKYAEGFEGLYHHASPPAGVVIYVEDHVFRSHLTRPLFDVYVHDDFGFAGTDEYGFSSDRNVARNLHSAAPLGRLDVSWHAQTFNNQLFTGVDLPFEPPDLKVLGGGTLRIEGECTICLGPAAYFTIEGPLTSLSLADPPPPWGDVNRDAAVNRADLAMYTAMFGVQTDVTPPPGDLDEDLAVSLVDLALWRRRWDWR